MAGPDYTVPLERFRVLAAFAVRREWDLDELLRCSGISPSPSRDGLIRVTPEQVNYLFTALLRATRDELLGLGVGPVPVGTFRMLGHAILGAPDLRHALARLQHCKRAVPGIPPIHVATHGSTTTLSIDLTAIDHPLDLLIDTTLAAMHRMMAWAINSRIRLLRVDIPHRHHPLVNDYDVIFAAPIRFSAMRPALVFPTATLASPIMRRDTDWDDFLRRAPGEMVSRRDYTVALADRARRILQMRDTGEWPTAIDAAQQLAMSPPTLRRRLREEATSLSQIREEILRDIAIASLTAGDETVTALSQRLGFSEPSAFIRAFRRWTGTSPGTYRLTLKR